MEQSYFKFLFRLAGKSKQPELSKSEKSLAKRNETQLDLIMSRFAGFNTTSSKFKTKELFYFYEVLEQLKTNICVNFQFERALRFLIQYALISTILLA